MTSPDAAEQTEVRDFTIKREPHRFKIDDDTFAAPAILSPIALKKLAGLYAELGDVGTLGADVERSLLLVAGLFKILLPGAHGQLFAARLLTEGGEEDPQPIDLMNQAMPIMYWLLERYGLRPTEPSSASPTGSTESETATPSDGISSTAGVTPPETVTT